MNVFISWSGHRSNILASALRQWLPDVLQGVTTWMSEHDLDAGARWSNRLSYILQDTSVGVICLTPECQNSAWVLFEAGALSKSVGESRLIPLLLSMSPADVSPPLSQFQSVRADPSGILKLIESINAVSENPLPSDRLRRRFERWWPDLDASIQQATNLPIDQNTILTRTDRAVLDEVLQIVRSIAEPPSRDRSTELTIQLDSTPLMAQRGMNGSVETVSYQPRQTVSRFLDNIFFWLRESDPDLPVYTYGAEWLLENDRTQEIYDQIGIEYCKSGGSKLDRTTLSKVGVQPGDKLFVIPAKK